MVQIWGEYIMLDKNGSLSKLETRELYQTTILARVVVKKTFSKRNFFF